jgi:hypothetical protein
MDRDGCLFFATDTANGAGGYANGTAGSGDGSTPAAAIGTANLWYLLRQMTDDGQNSASDDATPSAHTAGAASPTCAYIEVGAIILGVLIIIGCCCCVVYRRRKQRVMAPLNRPIIAQAVAPPPDTAVAPAQHQQLPQQQYHVQHQQLPQQQQQIPVQQYQPQQPQQQQQQYPAQYQYQQQPQIERYQQYQMPQPSAPPQAQYAQLQQQPPQHQQQQVVVGQYTTTDKEPPM